jgi:hypothetical protein
MTPAAAMEFNCDAQRLLNPFRGIINTSRYQSASLKTWNDER